MTSFVTSILHSSASKIEKTILGANNKNPSSRLAVRTANGSSPLMNYSTEFIPAPPPYDTMHLPILASPTPTPSTSWTSEMSVLAEKIRDDVTSTLKGTNRSNQQHVDRRSVSQGMKLVSIAADEYEGGNESVALNLYLTGVDKILMALPNKTDINTKTAIREKLQSVEERVGIQNLANIEKRQQEVKKKRSESPDAQQSSYILSCIASTIGTIGSKAYQAAVSEESDGGGATRSNVRHSSPCTTATNGFKKDSMSQFKQLGQYLIDMAVAIAILIKQSPLPDFISYVLSCFYQLLLWADFQYSIIQKIQDTSIQIIKLSLQADEKYRIHEYISEGFYMVFAAGIKAAVAFKEAPRYKDSIEVEEPLMCSPQAPQKTKVSWLWVP